MELAEHISSIVSALAAVVALVITVAIYWHGLKREIQLETIKTFSEIRKNTSIQRTWMTIKNWNT